MVVRKRLFAGRIGKNDLIFFSAALLVLAFDQLTKLFAKNIGQPVSLIKGLLSISLVTNTGASFGIFPGASPLLALVGLAVVLGIIFYYKNIPDVAYVKAAFGMVLGGTLGNLADRIVLGHVVDFISFSFWPAFNIADSAITLGAAMLILYFAIKPKNI